MNVSKITQQNLSRIQLTVTSNTNSNSRTKKVLAPK